MKCDGQVCWPVPYYANALKKGASEALSWTEVANMSNVVNAIGFTVQGPSARSSYVAALRWLPVSQTRDDVDSLVLEVIHSIVRAFDDGCRNSIVNAGCCAPAMGATYHNFCLLDLKIFVRRLAAVKQSTRIMPCSFERCGERLSSSFQLLFASHGCSLAQRTLFTSHASNLSHVYQQRADPLHI